MSAATEITNIIQELTKASRETWKQIIESREDTPYIGVKQTIARALYEGKLEDTIRLMMLIKTGGEDTRKKKA